MALTLAVLALPVLTAGRHLDAPPAPGELARIGAALAVDEGGACSEVARTFYGASLGDRPSDALAQAADPQPIVTRARLVQIAFVGALGLLLYTATLLARGRVSALVTVGWLAVLPPIAQEGHRLRPETPAAVFGLLALVLMASLAQPVGGLGRGSALRRSPRRAAWQAAGIAACACPAAALAVASLPAAGASLLVPWVVLLLVGAQVAVRLLRAGRRRGLVGTPVHGGNRRLLPWLVLVIGSTIVTWWLLTVAVHGPIEALERSPSDVGALPANGLPRGGMIALLVLGGLAALLRTGLRFGRRGRVAADLVLFVHCAVLGAAALGGPGRDELPLAGPTAVVLAEGTLALGWLVRRAAVGRATAGPRG